MVLCIYIVLLFLESMRSECPIDSRSHGNKGEIQLHADLLRNHVSTRSPKPNDTVKIGVSFSIKSYNFDSHEEVFTLNTWLNLKWQDDRLKWNPSDYGGINDTVVSSMNIWSPGMRLFNVADEDDNAQYYYTPCNIRSDGQVKCSPRCNLKTWCKTKLAKWPLDLQTCVVDLGDWHTNGNVTFELDDAAIVYIEGVGSWKAVNVTQANVISSEVQIRLTVTVKRNGLSLVAAVVHPCIILSVFTIICLFLDVRDSLRLLMICFSLTCHMYLLSAINEFIPIRDADPPTLLIYYRGSIFITTVGIILTFVLHTTCGRSTLPPAWLFAVNEMVLKLREKIVAWPRWKCENGKHSQEWVDFANLINTIYSVVCIFVYLGMYFELIPSD